MEYIKKYNSKIGTICLSSDGEYLTGLWFLNSHDQNKHSNCIEKDLDIFDETVKWLNIYFSGKCPNFTPKYKIENLTPFRKKVIDIMLDIPYGSLVTYKDIAIQIAKERNIDKMSSQAVGNAVGWNPICIIIPCHRVIGSNMNLTGYGGGINNKIKLLEVEGHNINKFVIPKKGNKL